MLLKTSVEVAVRRERSNGKKGYVAGKKLMVGLWCLRGSNDDPKGLNNVPSDRTVSKSI